LSFEPSSVSSNWERCQEPVRPQGGTDPRFKLKR
jgi:hypothetical protein